MSSERPCPGSGVADGCAGTLDVATTRSRCPPSRFALWRGRLRLPARRTPAAGFEVANGVSDNADAFRAKERSLQLQVSAVAAQPAAGCDDAVARNIDTAALTHDVTDGAAGSRVPRSGGDIAISGDPAWRNSPHDRQQPRSEHVSEEKPEPGADLRASCIR